MSNNAQIRIEICDVNDEDLPSIQTIYSEQVLCDVSSWEEITLT